MIGLKNLITQGDNIMKIADKDEFEKHNVFGTGTPNTAYAKYFIGESYLNPLTKPEDGLHLLNVTFEPGCRNNWHIHHAKSGGGQLLICTAGEGWYQEEGKEPILIAKVVGKVAPDAFVFCRPKNAGNRKNAVSPIAINE